MSNFLLAYHGGGMPETEEERQQVMAAWGRWYQDIGEAVVDPGNPIGRASTIHGGGAVTDGGGANPVSGYTIIKADDLDGAVKLASGCPILQGGGTIEVCETFAVM
jgi:hypothetical protein